MAQRILAPHNARKQLHRLSIAVLEDLHDAPAIVLAGIAGNGSRVAEAVQQRLQALDHRPFPLLEIHLDKRRPQAEDIAVDGLDQQQGPVVLVDDVLNTGRTMAFAMLPFVRADIRRLRMLVLVNRDHLHYPLAPDFVGMSLATQEQEHIEVAFEEDGISAYLSLQSGASEEGR
jgi:pyrimidine operon attenuation protein/uracil phosphoribosyltransferase